MRSLLPAVLLAVSPVWAGEPEVFAAQATALGDYRYRLDVTIAHADEGWQHYVDRWEVMYRGEIYAVRTLHHPHVNEQPFTRSLIVQLPPDADRVELRAHDSLHGYGTTALRLMLPSENGAPQPGIE